MSLKHGGQQDKDFYVKEGLLVLKRSNGDRLRIEF